jgi:shikimate kinase
MGAGKTSVGRALGQRLNWIFEDLDDRIARRERRPIAEIFRDSGEAEFRRAETEALQEALEESRGGVFRIFALGGGAFVQEANCALLEAAGASTVFLDAGVEDLWNRCCEQATATGAARPLAQNLEQFRSLYDSRRTSYLQARLKIKTGGRTVEEIATDIAQALGLKKIKGRVEQGDLE